MNNKKKAESKKLRSKEELIKLRQSFTEGLLKLSDKHELEPHNLMLILLRFLLLLTKVMLDNPTNVPSNALEDIKMINKKLDEIKKAIALRISKQESIGKRQ